jgi:predicted dehydrogenase
MRLAFIGGHGHHKLRAALADPACGIDTPVAVAGDGHDDAAAEALARSIPDAHWYVDPADMLDHFLPHAVNVGAVYGFNGDLAALALERDIPVVCDKPIAATWEQFRRLQSLTADPRRVIATEFDFRCQAEFVAARQAVAEGLIGEVALAVAQKSYRFGTRPAWYRDRGSYPGTLMWVASHGIDIIPFTTGHRYQRVTGVQGNVTRPDYGSMEDHCVAVFQLDNGGSAVVHADYLRPAQAATHGDDRLRIAGSQGIIEIRGGRCLLTTNGQAEHDITSTGVTRSMHVELLAALEGQSEKYGTASSMETAEVLLHARDALDRNQFVNLAPWLQK